MRYIFLSLSIILIFVSTPSLAQNRDYAFSYDENGNLVEGIDQTYEYNEFNQLSRVLDSRGNLLEEYLYDYEGQRIKKTVRLPNGDVKVVYYSGAHLIREITDQNTEDTLYYYDENGVLLVKENPDGSKKYYHPDFIGSTTLVSQDNGNLDSSVSYLPFGESLDETLERFLFTGKEKDTTHLYYFVSRYYDPFLRQFTQPDTLLPNLYDPQQLNAYSYARNNPYRFIDPNGHNPLLLGAIGGLLVGAYDMISQIWNNNASMFNGTMDWSSVGRSAGIGTGAGLVGGATGVVVGSTGLFTGISGEVSVGAASGLMGGRGGQLTANIIDGQPLTNNMLDTHSMARDAVLGGVINGAASLAVKAKPALTSLLTSSNKSSIQKFPLSDLYAGHRLTDKADVLSTRENPAPITVFQDYAGRNHIWDGVRRSARSALIHGNDYVNGKLLNPTINKDQIYNFNLFLRQQHLQNKGPYKMDIIIQTLRDK